MYNDHEINLFFANAPKCPCYITNAADIPTCDIPKTVSAANPGRVCDGPDNCPIYYWLKVTGILAKANFPMDIMVAGRGPK